MDGGHVYPQGDICNEGLLCVQGDRSLVDFTSATVDGNGCVLYTWAGHTDPGNEGDEVLNYVSRQTSECFALPVVETTTTNAEEPASTLPRTGDSETSSPLFWLAITALLMVAGLGLIRRRGLSRASGR
jgi:LPXTG-motif cell wall-anchored protein